MAIKLNSSGLPAGCGSLQVRGRVWWAIYRDEAGHKVQANTGTTELAEARRVLAFQAMKVVRARQAALAEVLDGQQASTATSRRNDPAARDSRPRANRQKPAQAAGAGGTNPRQRSARKGEAQ